MQVSELGNALGLAGLGEDTITGLSVDSRTTQPGDCFIALTGSRVDGTRFIPDALASGAVFAIGGPESPQGPRVVSVEEPLDALGVLGTLVRERFTGPVVGITGSVGKTTVKEMLRQLVAPSLGVVVPDASHNNFEGVPRTLALITAQTDACVVELGTNAPGEIEGLCRIARPTIGVLTAIGPAHLEGLGSVSGVLAEKLDLARALPAGARLIVNGDDAVLREASFPSGIDVVFVGLEERPGVVAPPSGREPGTLPMPSGAVARHQLGLRVLERNLWIALMVARELGVADEDLARAATGVVPARLRGEVCTVGGATVILDCYNANPLSMQEALSDLALRPGPRGAALGEMLELGAAGLTFHRDLGRQACRAGCEHVIFVGSSADAFSGGFEEEGGDPSAVTAFSDADTARGAFRALLDGSSSVLVKGSRGMALERLLEEDA